MKKPSKGKMMKGKMPAKMTKKMSSNTDEYPVQVPKKPSLKKGK